MKKEFYFAQKAFGEDVDSHLMREVREEVGLDVEPGEPFHIWQWRLERKNQEGEEVTMQIVAVARLCRPLSLDTSAGGQVAEDYIGDMRWVPADKILEYDLIPNLIPVVRSFLKRLNGGSMIPLL